MDVGALLVLLLLACPLLMIWMMRGGHGAHGGMHAPGGEPPGARSLDELRRRRDELDAAIARLEQPETETESKTPAAV